MKKYITKTRALLLGFLAVILAATTVAAATETDTLIMGRFVVSNDYDGGPTCATASGDGSICVDGDVETEDDLDVGDDATVRGNLATVGTSTFTGDLTLNGGAGCLTTTGSGDSTLLAKDADATAFCMGATGALDLVCLDTTDASPAWDIKGVVGQVALHVDQGTILFDEKAAMNAGFSSSVTGADVMTLTGAAPTITLADNKAAALAIKSSGTETTFIVIDTQTGAEKLYLKGAGVGVETFKLDVGTATFDEIVTMSAGFTSAVTGADAITLTGAAPTITLKDNEAAALAIKSSGTETDFIKIDTQTGAEKVYIKGASAGVETLKLDVGTAVFDEQVTMTAGFTSSVTAADAINLTGAAPTMTIKDNEAAAFAINSSGTSSFIVIDTTTGAEELTLTGANVGVSTFRIDQGIATFDEAPTCSAGINADGDILAGGGAGALTFDAASASIVTTDNSSTGLDIGASGQTDMIRLDTTNGAEFVELRAPVRSYGIYETFGEGSGKGLFTVQADWTATDGTAGVTNYAMVGNGNVLGYVAIGDNAVDDVDMTATGLNIANDQADNEGRELFSGGLFGTTGRPFVIGTDPAFYFLTGINVGDVSGTDTLICGLRTLEAFNADFTAYDTYFGLGWNTSADPAALKVWEELNGAAGAQTDTTNTLANLTTMQIKILIDASGNATVEHDAVTPGTLAAPGSTSAFQFDDGDLVIPFCSYLEHNAGGLADTFNITHWEMGLQ